MKKLSILLSACIVLNSTALLSYAQGVQRAERSPIAEIKKAFETPPDMLDDTLRKVKRLEETTTAAPTDEDPTVHADPDTFRNPFIPQTPQAIKTADENPVEQPIEQTPEARPTVPIPAFTLSGLVWNTKKPAAILNGKIVAIGDQVSNWSISEITKEGVHVTFEDQNLWVKPIVDPNRSKATQPDQRNHR